MSEIQDKNINVTVIKRDGKKVEFQGSKIALAIKKGFDSIKNDDSEKYTEKDIHKIYNLVISRIENWEKDKIKIEEIQDIIEEELRNNGYSDVEDSFSSYRERRNQSRKIFFEEKKQHKFLKALENLGLNTSLEDSLNENSTKDTAIETMLKYGSAVSNEFTKSYLIKKKYVDAHESGDIHIHNIDFLPMGTTTCVQIDLRKLFKDGFKIGNCYFEEPQDILEYSNLAVVAIQANQNDQHGEQGIPLFDYYMSDGVLKTFKKQFKQTMYDFLEYTNFNYFAAMNGIEREIEKIESLEFDISVFDAYSRGAEELKKIFRISYEKAIQKTNEITYRAMEGFINTLNSTHSRGGSKVYYSSVNLGTDTSAEGRMVTRNFLEAMQNLVIKNKKAIFPVTIFKIKKGINYNKEDKNYDLFELACSGVANKAKINFSFLDTEYNLKWYKQGDINTEVAYMSSCARVIENVIDENRAVCVGRGNVSFTSINLPRIGIKYGIVKNDKMNIEAFYNELEEKLELVKDQLLDRFEIQCTKRASNFPFLLGQEVWLESEKVKEEDRLRKLYKHGMISIGFIGLAECLKALTGKYQCEDEKTQKLGLEIIEFMRKKVDEYSRKI